LRAGQAEADQRLVPGEGAGEDPGAGQDLEAARRVGGARQAKQRRAAGDLEPCLAQQGVQAGGVLDQARRVWSAQAVSA
jgi:hypothetical protein